MTQSLPPVDTGVVLPKSVRRQVAQANSHYKKDELAPTPAAPEVPPTPTEPPAASPPVAQEAAPPAAPASAEPPAPAAPETPPAPLVDWERKYHSVQGRNAQAQQTISSLRDRMAELEATVASTTRPAAAPAPERLVTDKEREEYGPDLIEVIGRRAREELNPLITTLKDEIAELRGNVQGTKTQLTKTGRSQLFLDLDKSVPEWRQLNDDQNFLLWLDLPDRYSGVIRQGLFDAALEQNNAPRVAAFFQGFLSEAASVPARADLTPAPVALTPVPAIPKVSLESFAAPGRAKSSAGTPPPDEKPFITRAEITAFYADVNRGKYRGNEAEKDRLERMIFDANADGRVQ